MIEALRKNVQSHYLVKGKSLDEAINLAKKVHIH